MHETNFTDALRPNPVCILKLPIGVYTLGHEVLLIRRRNALLLSSPETFSKLELHEQIFAIREAVWLCSDDYSTRASWDKPSMFNIGFRWNNFKQRMWLRRLKNCTMEDYQLASVEFRNHVAKPLIPSPGEHAIEVLYGKEDNEKGRNLGQPLLVSLYNFVVAQGLHKEDGIKCAWDYPFAAAMWLFFGKLETEGSYRIENFQEYEEQAAADAPLPPIPKEFEPSIVREES